MAMNKKLIDSISNFASALEQLVEQLKERETQDTKKTSIFSKFFSRDSSSKIMKKVQEGINDIKKDTSEIIKNQKELLKLDKAKKKEDNKNIIEETGEKSQLDKIKSGVGSIILIAGAILALGFAFKIVGKVDVISVLVLSFAITLLGHTLAKLNDSKIPTPNESLLIGLALLSFTTAIVASSWLMSIMAPVSISQLLTFGAILGTFALLSSGIKTLIESTEKVNYKQLIILPLVLVGISFAIVASSYILQNVVKIPDDVLWSALKVGAIMGLVAMVMSVPLLILSKMGKNAIVGALFAVIILPALAYGIKLSSDILNDVKNVPASILYNVMLIGLTMGLVALVMSVPLLILSKMGKNAIVGALFAVIILPALAYGIRYASEALQDVKTVPPSTLVDILFMGLALAAITIIMTIPLMFIGKFGTSILKGALFSVIVLPLISLAVMISSHIMALGNYTNPIPLDWALSFSLTMLILAIPVILLGAVSPVTVAFGALGLVLVAAAISLSSWLFAAASPKGFRVIADAIAYFIDVITPPIIKFVSLLLPILAKGMGLLYKSVLPPLSKFIKEVLPVISDFLTDIIDGIFPVIELIFDTIKHLISSVSGIFDSIGKMIERGSIIFPRIGEMFKLIGEGMAKPLEVVGAVIESFGNTVVRIISSVIDALERYTKLDPNKLKNVGSSLTHIASAIKDLTGGWTDTALQWLSGGKSDPITRILKSISDHSGGVEGVSKSLSDIPELLKGINEFKFKNSSFESLINGVNKLNDIDVTRGSAEKVLNILDRINEMDDISGKVETINKSMVEINGVTTLTDPKNEEILSQLKVMNQLLYVISSNSGTISNQLNKLRDTDDEPGLSFK